MSFFNKACYIGGGLVAVTVMSGILGGPSGSKIPGESGDDGLNTYIEHITPANGFSQNKQSNSLPPPDPNNTNAIVGNGGELSQNIAGRVGESTYDVNGTQNGNLACAYVVNSVYQQSTGQTIVGPGGNNLAVFDTMQAMDSNPSKFVQVDQATAISSGKDYIIASNYSYGSNGSHIGIGNGSTVWSNSSGSARIQQNYTTQGWSDHFGATKYYIVNK